MSATTAYEPEGHPVRSCGIRQRIRQACGRAYARLAALEGAPRKIALGFALGILVGMTPFWGVHILSCLVLAAVMRWSKVAAVFGVQITNVGTAPLIYPVNYWVGLKLLGVSSEVAWPEAFDYSQMFQFLWQSPLILVDLFVGGLILGLPLSLAGYLVTLWAVRGLRRRA